MLLPVCSFYNSLKEISLGFELTTIMPMAHRGQHGFLILYSTPMLKVTLIM